MNVRGSWVSIFVGLWKSLPYETTPSIGYHGPRQGKAV